MVTTHTPLPNIHLTLSLEDAYALYAAGVADGAGDACEKPGAALASLLTTLRGRWFDDHTADLLSAIPDAPAWLRAQQTLAERRVGDATPIEGWGVEGWPV